MKRILLLLFTVISLSANAQEQERGVYATDLVRQESTGNRFEQNVIISVGRKYLIMSMDERRCGDYILDSVFSQSGNATAYLYRVIGEDGIEIKIGFEFVRDESGAVVQINIFPITADGERQAGEQFLEVRKML